MSRPYKVVMLFVGLLFAGTAHVQEVQHAPTVEQCRADQRLWFDKLENTTETLPTYHTLRGWSDEMGDCEHVDPENKLRYYNVVGEIAGERTVRFVDFLTRHELYDKFIEEDEAGKR
jgi:hypothetical protein